MADPQPTDAHLRIAHSINEQLMVSHFSEQQRRILDFILRLSWGCGNKVAYIPHQRDFEIVGVHEGHVKAHLDWLVEAKVISRQGHYYQFNKNFDQWRVSRSTGYTEEKLTEIVSLNLKHDKPELTENVNGNLRNREETVYGKGKLSTKELALPKEILNKVLKKYIYIPYPEFSNVNKMSREEHQKLIDQFGENGAKERIENLSLYIASKGDKYKNHYATILAWDKRDKKGGQGGAYRGSPREIRPRDSYTKPEDYRA